MIFINAKIYTMEDGLIIENGYIIVEGKKIKKIGEISSNINIETFINQNPVEQIIDLNGKSIYPGFIDCHCHIGMWEDGLGFEGDDGNEETNPITPQIRAIDAINPFDFCFREAVMAGITTVITGPGSANPIGGQWCAITTKGDYIDDMIISSPVGMKFALGENPKSVYHAKHETPVTRMAIASLIRENLIKARKYMEDKIKAEDDEENDEPDYDMLLESLIPVLKREIKAFFHCHRADDIATAIRLSKEFNLDLVIVHGTEGYKIAKKIKEENINVITGPIICDRSKPELKGLTPKNTAILNENGILTAVCTDHPVIPIQYLNLSAAICVKEGLDYIKALENITCNPAKICGIFDCVGSIKEDKLADLIVFEKDSNPLDILVAPCMVVINGKIINKD